MNRSSTDLLLFIDTRTVGGANFCGELKELYSMQLNLNNNLYNVINFDVSACNTKRKLILILKRNYEANVSFL